MSKFNNIEEFKGISKAIWKFVSTIYNSGWNSLFADNYNNSFRQKVLFKCTPKTNPVKSGKKEEKENNKLASIKRLSP